MFGLFSSGVNATPHGIISSGNWTIFGPVPAKQHLLTDSLLSAIKDIPEELNIAGDKYKAQKISPSEDGIINFASIFYPKDKKGYIGSREGNQVYLMAEIECSKNGEFIFGGGADWWMKWYVDGKPVFDTFESGNRRGDFAFTDHIFKVNLTKGKHLVTVVVKSGSHGWKFAGTFNQKYRKIMERLAKVRMKEAAVTVLAEKKLKYNALKSSKMKLAVFGSSVAFGGGATKSFGWARQLAFLLKKRNWTIINKSVGGDNTVKAMARFNRDLLPESPDIVIIGLSLGNEGLMGDSAAAYKQYVGNIRKLIQMCRKNNMIPVVSNCYPNNAYNKKHYMYIKKFNELLNSWQVASFDFLGSVDNGNGHWQEDCWRDSGHPNDLGHQEMFYSISPSLFDNLIDQYYTIPQTDNSWMNCSKNTILNYSPKDTIHSFSMAMKVCLQSKAKGVIATVNGNAIVVNDKGNLAFELKDGNVIASEVAAVAGTEYHLTLTNSYVNGFVKFYIDGKNAGSVKAKLVLVEFCIGKTPAYIKDFLLYRSCLHEESVQALFAGTIFRSSLELYAPLTDKIIAKNSPLINYAQTDAALIVKSAPIGNILPRH